MKKVTILIILMFSTVNAETQKNHKKIEQETKALLVSIKGQIMQYKFKTGKFPLSLDLLKINTKDGWGRKLIFKINKKRFNGYDLYSLGRDGIKSKDDIHLK